MQSGCVPEVGKPKKAERDIRILVWQSQSSADLSDFIRSFPTKENDSPNHGWGRSSHDSLRSSSASGVFVTATPSDSRLPPIQDASFQGAGEENVEVVLNWDTYAPRGSSSGHSHKSGDISDWFNYGFNEDTFKQWIQWQLATRRERLHNVSTTSTSV